MTKLVEIDVSTQFISGFGLCHADVKAFLTTDAPGFFSRIGGSDFDVVAEYFSLVARVGPTAALERLKHRIDLVKGFNGYYDREERLDKFGRYCGLLLESYQRCSHLFVCGAPLLSQFFPQSINEVFRVDTHNESSLFNDFLGAIGKRQQPARFYPYGYVEHIIRGNETLFRAFEQHLPDKRVLAVTPFEASIWANTGRRHEFFPNYIYPEFELLTYNTPITYDGLPDQFYPDLDWFETLERMKREIAAIDFDVALLSCGSYALPLGVYIRDVLKRKAIYVGGCLQLFFGIMGRRYENDWFLDQINPRAFIAPVERERYLPYFHITEETAKEAFGAYF